MWVCYVDESGCRGALPSATSNIQPVFVLGALAVPVAALRTLTLDLLHLKRRFYAKALSEHAQFLDTIRFEVKGAEVRKQIAAGAREERRHAIGFTDKVLRLLEAHGARTFARVWVKPIGGEFTGKAVYTSSVQALCATYQDLLAAERSTGVMVADHVDPGKDADVSMSIFTQKYSVKGDPFDRIVDVPTFGHSVNHAGLQLADFCCSALLFPMAIQSYCVGRVISAHMRDYRLIRARYGPRVRQLQHRYLDEVGRWRGGVTVSDPDCQRASGELFGPRSSAISRAGSDGE